ncbi:ribose-phosphate pyrophosphokinase [Kamptonema cortianum]|nr:ribose-phosphate pyrophosphokinase [Geitlerinema splendidum]MDK3158369.1 ribose-phosphate pyrophosphokinase [Kamptonema cortianum]
MSHNGRSLSGMKLFAGNAHRELGHRVAEYLGIEAGRLTSTQFSDGEIRLMVDESARGNDVFILQPTCSPVNDSLMELLIMLDAFRRASATRLTVVMPYYGYARQDKKIKPREPVTARLVADLIVKAGAQRVVCVDLHAEQIQGFFDIPVDHLYGGPILGRHFVNEGYAEADDIVVVSPDVAGVARARSLAEMLKCPIAIIAKRRPEPNKVDIVEIIGDVEGMRCIMIDDMIDTGGSIIQGAEALLKRGATEVQACCTHPVFSGNASQRLQDSVVSRVVSMDTIPLGSSKVFPKLVTLPIAPLLGEAIRRIHLNESVSTLFNDWR